MTTIKHIILGALAVVAPVAAAAPAYAQVSGIATADPIVAMYNTKAWTIADKQIHETYKAQYAALDAKIVDRQKVLAQMDKNGDKQVDDAEQNAQPQLKAQVDKIDNEMGQISMPMLIAQGFAIDRILERYNEAQRNVVAAKKIGVILAPSAFLYYPDAADVTAAITTELDRLVPTVSIAPVANRRPSEESIQILQQFFRIDAARAQQNRPAPAPAPAAGAKPAPAPAPAGKPNTPPPGR